MGDLETGIHGWTARNARLEILGALRLSISILSTLAPARIPTRPRTSIFSIRNATATLGAHFVLINIARNAHSQAAEEERRCSSCTVYPIQNKGSERSPDRRRYRGRELFRSISKEALAQGYQEASQGQGQERCFEARHLGCFGARWLPV